MTSLRAAPAPATEPAAAGESQASRAVLVAGLAVALALTWAWASLPLAELVGRVPDDSYFYFQPASMMARGYVPSFEGVNPGNGFHPLWMFLITPIFALKAVDAVLPVHLALGLAGLLWVATGFLIYKILRLWEVDGAYAAWAAVTFALWPSGVAIAVDGEVTPITVLTIAAFFFAYLVILRRERARRRDFALLGVLAALAIMARLDNALLLALLAAHYLFQKRVENKVVALGVAGAVTALALAPWLLWTYAYSGTVVPSSGAAVPLMKMVQAPPPDAPAGVPLNVYQLGKRWFRLSHYTPSSYGIFLFYAAAVVIALKGAAADRPRFRFILLFLCWLVALWLLHQIGRSYIRLWHLGAAFLVNQLLLWSVIYALTRGRKWSRPFVHALGAAFLLFFVWDGVYTWRHPYYPWNTSLLKGAAWSRAHPGMTLAAFNAGYVGYYGAENVVALDGNMNLGAFDALKRRRLYDYCRGQRIQYIIDYGDWIKKYQYFWPTPMGATLEAADILDRPEDRPFLIEFYGAFRLK